MKNGVRIAIIIGIVVACLAGIGLGLYFGLRHKKSSQNNGDFQWMMQDTGDIPSNACSKTCGGGVAYGAVWCVDSDGNIADDSKCSSPKPTKEVKCNTQACADWTCSGWSTCPKCDDGKTKTQTRTCTCEKGPCGVEPSLSQPCTFDDCTYDWKQSYINITSGKWCGKYGSNNFPVAFALQANQNNDGTIKATVSTPKDAVYISQENNNFDMDSFFLKGEVINFSARGKSGISTLQLVSINPDNNGNINFIVNFGFERNLYKITLSACT